MEIKEIGFDVQQQNSLLYSAQMLCRLQSQLELINLNKDKKNNYRCFNGNFFVINSHKYRQEALILLRNRASDMNFYVAPLGEEVIRRRRHWTSRFLNKYERYYGPGRHPLAYVLYYMSTISPACT